MSAPTNEPGSRGADVAEKIKVLGVIVGIVSALVAIASFIGFKPEKKQILEWEYVSKSSLVNPETPATEKIQVFYDGRQIKQLTVITAKLSNTGSFPIEGDDEMYPTVRFSEKVIRADAREPNRRGIKADARFDEHSVEIQHGLLNPGDSIPIQILIEGDPGQITALPPVLYRIAGIEDPITRFPSATKTRVGVAYFNFARALDFTILIIASLIPFLFVALAVTGIAVVVEDMRPEKKLLKITSNPALLSAQPGESLPSKLATRLYVVLPAPFDSRARDLAEATKQNEGESLESYVNRAIASVKEQIMPKRISERLKLLDKGNVLAVAAILFLSLVLSLILLGSWYRIISNS